MLPPKVLLLTTLGTFIGVSGVTCRSASRARVRRRDGAYLQHSYGSAVDDHTVAACDYGFDFTAVAASESGNVMGTLHPEKSGKTGLRLLADFVAYAEAYQDGRVPAD
jgi:imidazoleglycerol phosphate synthase glutamine amidotransferase subunit HisH